MSKEKLRAEIVVNGLVQGVGFRYYAFREAEKIGINGFVKNLYTGDVYIVAEGGKHQIEEYYNKLKIGPMYADVRNASIKWDQFKDEFTRFEIRH